MIAKNLNSLTVRAQNETIRIEAWGRGLRVCSVPFGSIPNENWALDFVEAVSVKVELASEDEAFAKPEWLGEEVTGDVKYYNSMLMKNPYKNWAK